MKNKTKRTIAKVAVPLAAIALVAGLFGLSTLSNGGEPAEAPTDPASATTITGPVGEGIELLCELPVANAAGCSVDAESHTASFIFDSDDRIDNVLGKVAYITDGDRLAQGQPGWVASLSDSKKTQDGKTAVSAKWVEADGLLRIDGADVKTANTVCDLLGFKQLYDSAKGSTELTEMQAEAVKSYGDKQKTAAATLQASLWMRQSGSTTARFYESTYSVTSSNGIERGSYAVGSVIDGQTITQQDSSFERTTVSVLGQDGAHVVIIDKGVTGPSAGSLTLTTDLLEGQSCTYSAGKPANSFELLKADKLDAALDGHASDVEEKLREAVAKDFPTASAATWSGKTETIWDNGATSTEFTLNNTSKTILHVLLAADGTISVSKDSQSVQSTKSDS